MAKNWKKVFEAYKTASFEDMKQYIDEEHPEDKAEFKAAAIKTIKIKKKGRETGKEKPSYSHLEAKKWFYGRYFPELIPVSKEPKKTINAIKQLENW